jgi:two-component system phosphate regulon sensor histidine kinase PhoR
LYTITAVIIATIGIQIYWNYKNYVTNKQQLIRDVQISLDKAVDDYYAQLAKETTIGFSFDGSIDFKTIFDDSSELTNVLKTIDENDKKFTNLDSSDFSTLKNVTVVRGKATDSMLAQQQEQSKKKFFDSKKTTKINSIKINKKDINTKNLQFLASQFIISIKNDTLDDRKVYRLLKDDFERKSINIDFDLVYYETKIDSVSLHNRTTDKGKFLESKFNYPKLSVQSKSTFLPEGSSLQVSFTNEANVILNRILGGILISILLVLSVISCLFYLLKIIKHQKQLAEVKNDLISNITHEFKTPIATIGVALESINNFNAIDDKAKTKKYIAMSSNQLSKLNIMVEKLLETATLDSDSLQLNKEAVAITELLSTLSHKYQIHNPEKTIKTNFEGENIIANVDLFHFENALNNILDNAVKYGGDKINLNLVQNQNNITISITDNGAGISKANKDRIFEKFYRIPKGNTHDVKGFGIGLYYTKTIIDKHGGTISLDFTNTLTAFKIELPHV